MDLSLVIILPLAGLAGVLVWFLIREFKKLTGIPMLLNTSFNVQEPIVCTPQDAINTFGNANFDALVLENNLVLREESP